MFKKPEIIKWIPWNELTSETALPPVPAVSTKLPEFYRKIDRFTGGELKFYKSENLNGHEAQANLSIKHCMPFFDATTGGYHYLSYCDIYVSNENGKPKVSWRAEQEPMSIRGVDEIPVPQDHYKEHFSWQMWWGMKTPPGWSVLITHPLNRTDLPFTTVSGIVDFDKYSAPGNISFHIKQGFEGVIKAGTPIFTIIPIKRAHWTSEVAPYLTKESNFDQARKKTVFYGYYKKYLRQEKKYE